MIALTAEVVTSLRLEVPRLEATAHIFKRKDRLCVIVYDGLGP